MGVPQQDPQPQNQKPGLRHGTRADGYIIPPGSPLPEIHRQSFLHLLATAPQVIQAAREASVSVSVSVSSKSGTGRSRSGTDVTNASSSPPSQATTDPDVDAIKQQTSNTVNLWTAKQLEADIPYLEANGWGWDPAADPTDPAEEAKLAEWLANKEYWMILAAQEEASVLIPGQGPTARIEEWMTDAKRRALQQEAPLPPALNFPEANHPDNLLHKDKNKDLQGDFRMQDSNDKPIGSFPEPRIIEQQRLHPNAVKPIAGTTFAPPYCSNMLRQRPHLAPGLHHVNCSYLTAKARPRGAGGAGTTFEGCGINADAPTLGELKQHVQSLPYLVKQIGFSTSAAEIDAELRLKQIRGDPTADHSFTYQLDPPNFIADTGVFDFLHNLDQEYEPKETYDKIPLTHLLNTVEWRDNHSDSIVDVCPLIRLPAEAINRHQHPMPFARVESLMAHADSALLMLDNALSASGGLLSALPINLPASDSRRKTCQMENRKKADDELKTLTEEVLAKKDDANIELQSLREAHKTRVKTWRINSLSR